VVTLTGIVHEDSHKQLAQETVSGLPGVKSVANQIEVKDSPPEQSDTWLYLKVKGALAYHSSVSAYNTKVDLKQGVVTLTGEAVSQAQKDLTTEYARDVDGIKDVKNEMTVVTKEPGPTLAEIIDDASITAQVRMALLTHRSTSAFRTIVATMDDVVMVGGTAKNAAEKELVTKLVTDINGVKSVVNNMVVELAAAAN
jgi:hyperosmotically inducible protein